MNKSLTTQEQEELNRASNALNLDSDTKKLANTLFLESKQKSQLPVTERLPLVIYCAIYVAAKSQIITTVNGDTIRGVGISINQILRALEMSNRPTNLPDFLKILKEFIGGVTISQDILQELKSTINKFVFFLTFFIKYTDLLQHLELDSPVHEHRDYLSYVSHFGWLVFLHLKATMNNNSQPDLIETVCVFAANLIKILSYLPKQVTIPYFEKKGIKFANQTAEQNEEAIQTGVFDLLKISPKSSEEINAQKKIVDEFLNKLLLNGVFKSSSGNELSGIFDLQTLPLNFEKLDAYYQKKLGFDDLDERFFRNKRAFQAGMFTPFAKQGNANKLTINFNITKNGEAQNSLSTLSQKSMNYDTSNQFSMKSNLRDVKFTGNSVPSSPFGKVPPATPLTQALKMYNWLSEKVKSKNNQSMSAIEEEDSLYGKLKDEIYARAKSIIENVLNSEKDITGKVTNPSDRKAKDKQTQMENLYLKVLEELLNQEKRRTHNPNSMDILGNENFHKALIACSIETVFFVNNSSNIPFARLLELCDIQPFEFWRIIGSFSKIDPQMPLPIKHHLNTLEIKIITNLAWKKNSVVHQIIQKYIKESKNDSAIEIESPLDEKSPRKEESTLRAQKSTSNTSIQIESQQDSKTELTHSQELFFKRVLHYTALNISKLSELLQLKETTSELVWSVMKYILSSETTLLIDRHLDQIILSSIYGVCKVSREPYKFQEIINSYQELPSFEQNDYFDIIHQVYINETEKADLIKFYNIIFIPQMRAYLFTLTAKPSPLKPRTDTPQIKKPLVPALVMDSPLRDSFVHQKAPVPYNIHNRPMTPQFSYKMTPRTEALYHFGESPSRNPEGIGNVISRRQINFDEGPESNNSFEHPLVKKLKPANPILSKILEQKEDAEIETNLAPRINLLGATSQSNTNSKFSVPEDSLLKRNNSLGSLSLLHSKSQLNFDSPESGKMNIESPEAKGSPQQINQNQASPPGSKIVEQSGFQKVQKKDETIIPELKTANK